MRSAITAPFVLVATVSAFSPTPPPPATFEVADTQVGHVSPPNPSVPLSFEAASIKPSDPHAGPNPGIRSQPGGRFSTVNTSVNRLITFAYQLQNHQLVNAVDWAATDRFDIVAKLAGDPPQVMADEGPDHMMLAMRTLLADRFDLVVHHEQRELDLYSLVMVAPGQPGKGMTPSGSDCAPEQIAARRGAPLPARGPLSPAVCGVFNWPDHIRFGGFGLSLFAAALANRVGRAVVDRTGLAGRWDFDLTFAPEAIAFGASALDPSTLRIDADAPDFFTALREQLGLRLVSAKGPVDVLVVDRIRHPTPD